jgi:hypothetical protein
VAAEAEPDIVLELLAANKSPVAASQGLTDDLVALFSSVLDTLPAAEQAAKVRRRVACLRCGKHKACRCLAPAAYGDPARTHPSLPPPTPTLQERRLRAMLASRLYRPAALLMRTAVDLALGQGGASGSGAAY